MPDDQEIIARATELIDSAFIGVMTTVDERGHPQARCIAAIADSPQLYRLYSLTGRGTRKVEHLTATPRLCWAFRLPDDDASVTVEGTAELLPTSGLPESVWDRLIDYTVPYALPAMQKLRDERHTNFVSIVTEIEAIEYVSPDRGISSPRRVEPR
ncbi:MAG: pyridoxamine 5'-phosphate oxidase family protein [Phycisphaeraceae bacterium]